MSSLQFSYTWTKVLSEHMNAPFLKNCKLYTANSTSFCRTENLRDRRKKVTPHWGMDQMGVKYASQFWDTSYCVLDFSENDPNCVKKKQKKIFLVYLSAVFQARHEPDRRAPRAPRRRWPLGPRWQPSPPLPPEVKGRKERSFHRFENVEGSQFTSESWFLCGV